MVIFMTEYTKKLIHQMRLFHVARTRATKTESHGDSPSSGEAPIDLMSVFVNVQCRRMTSDWRECELIFGLENKTKLLTSGFDWRQKFGRNYDIEPRSRRSRINKGSLNY